MNILCGRFNHDQGLGVKITNISTDKKKKNHKNKLIWLLTPIQIKNINWAVSTSIFFQLYDDILGDSACSNNVFLKTTILSINFLFKIYLN